MTRICHKLLWHSVLPCYTLDTLRERTSSGWSQPSTAHSQWILTRIVPSERCQPIPITFLGDHPEASNLLGYPQFMDGLFHGKSQKMPWILGYPGTPNHRKTIKKTLQIWCCHAPAVGKMQHHQCHASTSRPRLDAADSITLADERDWHFHHVKCHGKNLMTSFRIRLWCTIFCRATKVPSGKQT